MLVTANPCTISELVTVKFNESEFCENSLLYFLIPFPPFSELSFAVLSSFCSSISGSLVIVIL